MRPPIGRAYPAAAPFSPQPPFRLYAGEGHAPLEVSDTGMLSSAGERQLTLLTAVKVRPVLIITRPSSRFNEVLALRLRRFSALDIAEREIVREGRAEDLFYLRPEGFPDLPEENAAMITTALRLPLAAIDTSKPLGAVNESELRVIHERLVRAHGLDLRNLVLRSARQLLEAIQGRANE